PSIAFRTWRWPRNQSNHSGNSVKTSILNELDQHAPVGAGGCGLGDRADRVGDAPSLPDQPPEIIGSDRHLEHEVAVLLDLLDLDGVRVLDQRAGEELDQVAHQMVTGRPTTRSRRSRCPWCAAAPPRSASAGRRA